MPDLDLRTENDPASECPLDNPFCTEPADGDHGTCGDDEWPENPDDVLLDESPYERAERLIIAITPAAEALGRALTHEQDLEDRRCLVKSAAILRLMQTQNPETGKQHTASSAEKVVESDSEYLAYRNSQSAAVVARIQAEAAYASAKLRASLAQTSF